MVYKTKDLNNFFNQSLCFNLQFRRDIRHKRTGAPVYYSWKAQFVVVGPLDKEEHLREIQSIFNCGKLHFITAKQIRYSVQSVDDIHNKVNNLLKKEDKDFPLQLNLERKKDFELWVKAIEILYNNKGKALNLWSKHDFAQLIEIQELIQKKIKDNKWSTVAKTVLDYLK